jgi:hypothetical protein
MASAQQQASRRRLDTARAPAPAGSAANAAMASAPARPSMVPNVTNTGSVGNDPKLEVSKLTRRPKSTIMNSKNGRGGGI